MGTKIVYMMRCAETATLLTGGTGNSDSRNVLAELFELLEQFSPSWFTEDHYNRVKAALRARS